MVGKVPGIMCAMAFSQSLIAENISDRSKRFPSRPSPCDDRSQGERLRHGRCSRPGERGRYDGIRTPSSAQRVLVSIKTTSHER